MSDSVELRHPTANGNQSATPNFTEIYVGDLTLWFSYTTIIAFAVPGVGRRVRENSWSTTTGKHLNSIDGGAKHSRLKGAEFERQLAIVLGAIGTALEGVSKELTKELEEVTA